MKEEKSGKDICELLKSIRIKIAEKYGVPYSPHVCTYEGECSGTCHACDAELESLTQEIEVLTETFDLEQLDLPADNNEETSSNLNEEKIMMTAGVPVFPEDYEHTYKIKLAKILIRHIDDISHARKLLSDICDLGYDDILDIILNKGAQE